MANRYPGLVPNHFMFCETRWMIPAMALLVGVLLTFLWAMYLYGVELDAFELDDYAISLPQHYPGVHHPQPQLGLHRAPSMQSVASTLASLQQVVAPAVVHLHGSRDLKQSKLNGQVPAVLASGVIVHPAGYLVTAAHVIAGHHAIFADVKTAQGVRRFPAELIKTVPEYNLALLKMQTTERFLYLRLADVQRMAEGTALYAYGLDTQTQIFGNGGALRQRGVVLSLAGQHMPHLFRTDAVVTWEQTGGPLVTSGAELAGINLAIADNRGGIQGYAVPADLIQAAFGRDIQLKTGVASSVPRPDGTPAWSPVAAATQVAPNIPALGSPRLPQIPPVVPAPSPSVPIAQGGVDPDHQAGLRIAGLDLLSALGLATLGFAAGIVGGMMTMGGGIILVSGMFVFFGYGMLLIRPVAFITNVFTYGAAAWKNRMAGLIHWDKVIWYTPWAVVGVLIGYALGSRLDDRMLGYLLGLFALLMATKTLHELFHHIEDDHDELAPVNPEPASSSLDLDPFEALQAGVPRKSPDTLGTSLNQRGLLGIPMGMISGLLGISGGVIEVPLQQRVAGIPLRNAIANSSVMVFWVSLTAAIVSLIHGNNLGAFEWQTPVSLALIMIPSSYFGGTLGARALRFITAENLKWVYVAIMLAIGIKMLFAQ